MTILINQYEGVATSGSANPLTFEAPLVSMTPSVSAPKPLAIGPGYSNTLPEGAFSNGDSSHMNWAGTEDVVVRMTDGTLFALYFTSAPSIILVKSVPGGGYSTTWSVVDTISDGTYDVQLVRNPALNQVHLVYFNAVTTTGGPCKCTVKTYSSTGTLLNTSTTPGGGTTDVNDIAYSAEPPAYSRIGISADGVLVITRPNRNIGDASQTRHMYKSIQSGVWNGTAWTWDPLVRPYIGDRVAYDHIYVGKRADADETFGICTRDVYWPEQDGTAPPNYYLFNRIKLWVYNRRTRAYTDYWLTAEQAPAFPANGSTTAYAQYRLRDTGMDANGNVWCFILSITSAQVQTERILLVSRDGTVLSDTDMSATLRTYGLHTFVRAGSGSMYVLSAWNGNSMTEVAARLCSLSGSAPSVEALSSSNQLNTKFFGATSNYFGSTSADASVRMTNQKLWAPTDRTGSKPTTDRLDFFWSGGANYPTATNSSTSQVLGHAVVKLPGGPVSTSVPALPYVYPYAWEGVDATGAAYSENTFADALTHNGADGTSRISLVPDPNGGSLTVRKHTISINEAMIYGGHRSELTFTNSTERLPRNTEYWLAFAVRPDVWPLSNDDNDRQLFFQIHQAQDSTDTENGPLPLNFYTSGLYNNIWIQSSYSNSNPSTNANTVTTDLKKDTGPSDWVVGKWYKFVIRWKSGLIALGEAPALQIWLDSGAGYNLLVDRTDLSIGFINAVADWPKLGIYKWNNYGITAPSGSTTRSAHYYGLFMQQGTGLYANAVAALNDLDYQAPSLAVAPLPASTDISGSTGTSWDGVSTVSDANGTLLQTVLDPAGSGSTVNLHRIYKNGPLLSGGHRSELDWGSREPQRMYPGVDYWMSFAMMIKSDEALVSPGGYDELLCFQTHTPAQGDTQPDISLQLSAYTGKMRWRVAYNTFPSNTWQTVGGPNPDYQQDTAGNPVYQENLPAVGTWTRFIVHYRPGYTTAHNPIFEVWRALQGGSYVKLFSYTGFNTYNSLAGPSYPRIGLYKWSTSDWATSSNSVAFYMTQLRFGQGRDLYDEASAVLTTFTQPPTYDDPSATQPGFLPGQYVSGSTVTVDFGVPANGASSFTYAFYRNGVAISGASGTTVSRYQTYTAVAGDADTVLSCQFTAANAAGSSSTVAVEGIAIPPLTSLAGLFLTTVASDVDTSECEWWGFDSCLIKTADDTLWTVHVDAATSSYIVQSSPAGGGSGAWTSVAAAGVISASVEARGGVALVYNQAYDVVHLVHITSDTIPILRIHTWSSSGSLIAANDYPNATDSISNPTYRTGSTWYMRVGIDSGGQIIITLPYDPIGGGFTTDSQETIVGAKWNGSSVAWDTVWRASSDYRIAYGYNFVSGRNLVAISNRTADLHEINATTWPSSNTYMFSYPTMITFNLDTLAYTRTAVGTQYDPSLYPTYRFMSCIKTADGRYLALLLRNSSLDGSAANTYWLLALDASGNTLDEHDVTSTLAGSGFGTLVETADGLVNLIFTQQGSSSQGFWVSKVTHSGNAYTVGAKTSLASFWGNMATRSKIVTTDKRTGSGAMASTIPFIFDRGSSDHPAQSFTNPCLWQLGKLTIDEH